MIRINNNSVIVYYSFTVAYKSSSLKLTEITLTYKKLCNEAYVHQIIDNKDLKSVVCLVAQ